LASLKSELPPETKFVTAEERKTQQAGRAAAYAWRLMDH